jgi:streptogramin lyase
MWLRTAVAVTGAVVAASFGIAGPALAEARLDMTEFEGAAAEGFATAIAAGPDGAVWVAHGDGTFTTLRPDATKTRRARRTVARVPRPGSYPGSLAVGPDRDVWFTEQLGNRIGRVGRGGGITEYPLPNPASGPTGIVLGPDRALWFTEQLGNRIGRIATDGTITEYPLPNPASGPTGITVGLDRALWFTEQYGNRIGRIATDGTITEYALPNPASGPTGITVGPDRALWFTETFAHRIGRIGTDARHRITEAVVPTASFPEAITLGTDGALWFTARAGRVLGRVTTGRRPRIAEFDLPPDSSSPTAITAACDGRIWFTQLTGEVGAVGPFGADTCRPERLTEDPTGSTVSVLGPSRLTAVELARWYRSTKSRANLAPGVDVESLARIFLEEASAAGVRADLAFAQSMLETGFLDFPARGQVRPTDNNFAGLGACDSCTRGRIFPTARDGVRAQMQHLRNYADGSSRSTDLGFPPSPWWYGADPVVAARNFDTFFAKGRAPSWLEMGAGNWATDPNYRHKVLRIYQQMLTFASS